MMSDLYFNEESDYSEEKTSENDDFHSTILKPFQLDPAGNYMFKVNNRNTRTRCETCSKLTKEIPEPRMLILSR